MKPFTVLAFLLVSLNLFSQMDLKEEDFKLYFSDAPYKNLHLYSPVNQVTALLGQPRRIVVRENPDYPDFNYTVHEYDGINVLYYQDLEEIAGYEILSDRFQSYRGIRIGDSIVKVQDVYPARSQHYDARFVIDYFHPGLESASFFREVTDGYISWDIFLYFEFVDGKVSAINLHFQNH